MIWIISYRIVGDNAIKTIEKDLQFTNKHDVGKWFDMNRNGIKGTVKRNVEFVNAKIKEINEPQTTVLTERMDVGSKEFKKFQKILLKKIKSSSK